MRYCHEGGVREVTIGIAIACKDGVVVGADRKVTRSRGTRIKSLEDKIVKLRFRDGRKLLICSAGGSDFARRAVEAIDPSELGSDVDCASYRDMIEGIVSRLQARLANKGLEYDATLLFGMIDIRDAPVIGHIVPTGLTEMGHEGYFTAGIAAPYAELVLKDSYSPQISIEDAKFIVGGLIEKIGKVDNDVEGMDVFSISVSDKKIKALTQAERQAIGQTAFSFNFKHELEDLKKTVETWNHLFKQLQQEEKPPKK